MLVNKFDKFTKFKVTATALEAAAEQEYILNGSIAVSRITTIYASPNKGKTTFCIAVANLYSTIYIDAENPLDTFPEIMLSRCEVYSSSMGASIKDLEDIIKTIVDAKITDKLLIIDTLSHFANPNDNVDVQKFYNLLQQVKNNGNSVIVLHHTNKGDSTNPDGKKEFFGSSVIQAQTDTMLYLDGFDDGDGNIIVTLEPEKKRGYIDKKSYKVSTLDFTIEEVFDTNPEQLHKDEQIIKQISSFLTKTRTTTQIIDYMKSLKYSSRTTNEILNRYIGRFWNKGGTGKKREWILIVKETLEEELPQAS